MIWNWEVVAHWKVCPEKNPERIETNFSNSTLLTPRKLEPVPTKTRDALPLYFPALGK
jgi:hypothetical protein